MAKKPRKKFYTGEGNLDMIKNSVRAIKHHADELTSELKKNPEIEAWVLAKVDRAAQNLSDVTHYLDGEMNKFAKGGKTPIVRTQFEEEEFEYADGGEVSLWKVDKNKVEKLKTGSKRAIKGYITKNKLYGWNRAVGENWGLQEWPTDATEEEILRYNSRSHMTATSQEYADGGRVSKEYKLVPMIPYGVKGMITPDYKSSQKFVGTEDEAVAKAKELANSNPNFVRVEIKRELKTKTNTVGIVDGQNKQYAKGGETKPSLIPDYKKISSVEVEDIDMADYPDFSDAYISYAEYDGEPMTDEQLEELNQDGSFVYDAIQRRLFAKGGRVKRKRWIQDAIKPETKGALRATAKRKGLLKGDEKLSKSDLHKLEKMGGKTARRARFAETLSEFKK